MSDIQHSQISHTADQFDPTLLENFHYDETADYSSSDSYDEEDDLKFIKQKAHNFSSQQSNAGKVYHQNQYTKLDQKMCLSKIQTCENQQLIKEKKNKDKVQRATVQQVLDPRTMTILKKLLNNGTFTQINGCLSTGKQANVYYAVKESSEGKKQYAVKIYKTSILVFKDRERYVQGQFRFRRGYCATNPRKMVKMWAQKQLRNLTRIQGVIPCPVPLLVKTNVLVMDFIGKDGIPAPKLKQIEKTFQEFSQIYLQMLIVMRNLYQQCKLIHADLSEYNLLYYDNKIQMIDVSQSVQRDHPQALSFLQRDIKNINDFFDKKRVKVFSEEQVFQFIVSLDIAKGKQKQILYELIEHYDGQKISDSAFDKIKIHQNLSSIPLDQVQRQLFRQSQNNVTHKTITDITLDKQITIKPIHQQQQKDQSDSDSDSSDSSSQKNKDSENLQQGSSQKKQGGKQKYQGLSKLQRKHKVKEQKRQKRKDKIPKKEKKKMLKKR